MFNNIKEGKDVFNMEYSRVKTVISIYLCLVKNYKQNVPMTSCHVFNSLVGEEIYKSLSTRSTMVYS